MTGKDDGKAGHKPVIFPAQRQCVAPGITATPEAANAFRRLKRKDRIAIEETINANLGAKGERGQYQLKSALRTIRFETVNLGGVPQETCVVKLEIESPFSWHAVGRGAYWIYLALAISYYLIYLGGKLPPTLLGF